jgi:hypothetical protein
MQTIDDYQYFPAGTIPTKPPPAPRLLVHNHVAHTTRTRSGTRGFRGWTQPPAPNLQPCKCGWSGLPHFHVIRKGS